VAQGFSDHLSYHKSTARKDKQSFLSLASWTKLPVFAYEGAVEQVRYEATAAYNRAVAYVAKSSSSGQKKKDARLPHRTPKFQHHVVL